MLGRDSWSVLGTGNQCLGLNWTWKFLGPMINKLRSVNNNGGHWPFQTTYSFRWRAGCQFCSSLVLVSSAIGRFVHVASLTLSKLVFSCSGFLRTWMVFSIPEDLLSPIFGVWLSSSVFNLLVRIILYQRIGMLKLTSVAINKSFISDPLHSNACSCVTM